MKLQVAGLHMDVGESLKNHCEEASKALKAYFPEIIEVDVYFSKDQHKEKAEVKVHASQIHLRAEASAEDFYGALDQSIAKLLRQLDKYKGRLQKHRRRRDGGSVPSPKAVEAIYQTIQESSLEETPDDIQDTAYTPDVDRKDIKSLQMLTLDEAVMQMDLLHTSMYLFLNAQTQELNVVNREEDGTVGWVELGKVMSNAQAMAS